jgi:excisionase family DNA binding protein
MDECLLLSPREVAEKIGVSRETVYSLIKKGEIPHCKLGGSVRVPASALHAVINARVSAAAVQTLALAAAGV